MKWKKLLIGYFIVATLSLMGIGYYHAYKEHTDFTLTLILPPWAVYRGIECFQHYYPPNNPSGKW